MDIPAPYSLETLTGQDQGDVLLRAALVKENHLDRQELSMPNTYLFSQKVHFMILNFIKTARKTLFLILNRFKTNKFILSYFTVYSIQSRKLS